MPTFQSSPVRPLMACRLRAPLKQVAVSLGSLSSLVVQGRRHPLYPIRHRSSQVAVPPSTILQRLVHLPLASGSATAVLSSLPFCILGAGFLLESPHISPASAQAPTPLLVGFTGHTLALLEPGFSQNCKARSPCRAVSQSRWAVLHFMAASPCSMPSAITAPRHPRTAAPASSIINSTS